MKWRQIKAAVPGALFFVCLTFLAYLAGSLTTLADTFPSRYVRDAWRAGESLMLKQAYREDPYTSNLWGPTTAKHRGVLRHERNRTDPGFTLYTSGHDTTAVLVDMEGRQVHQWHRPFTDIWNESSTVRQPVPENQIYFRKAQAYPNGDLLVIYIGVGDTPWGYGMARLDKDSNVLWSNLDRFHHDFSVTEDGRIYALTHEFRTRPLRGHEHIQPPMLEDFLVVLGPDGRELQRVSLLDAVQDSVYDRELFRLFHFTLWDPLHTNAVDVLDQRSAAALATRIPTAAPGQVLLSFRELSGGTIALLDVERRQLVWATSGSWKSQHDPDVLPNGNILLFDNLGEFGPDRVSRVVEVDPASTGIVWSYSGAPGDELRSYWRAAQEPLANGNVLITESQTGRLLEVARDGTVVWEFVNPERGAGNPALAAIVSWASRIRPESLEPEFRAYLSSRTLSSRTATDAGAVPPPVTPLPVTPLEGTGV